jgi:hypothetical protein
MADVPEDWVKTALEVTGHFEDSANPLGAVTGDFDGMGISLGVLQWNIGSNSLQGMVKALGEDIVHRLMPAYGAQLWQACNSTIHDGLAVCRSWQRGAQLEPGVLHELKVFTSSDAFVEQQVHRVANVAATAYSTAQTYAAKDPSFGTATRPLFCWFFDLFTQNGGLKGLGYGDVHAFIDRNGADGALGVVCDWLASRPKGVTGYRDSNANATLWRTHLPASSLSLLLLSYLRCQLSRIEYRADVMNRKGTVAVQRGWVHGQKQDLTALLSPAP